MEKDPDWEERIKLSLLCIQNKHRVELMKDQISYLKRVIPKMKESSQRASEDAEIARQVFHLLSRALGKEGT